MLAIRLGLLTDRITAKPYHYSEPNSAVLDCNSMLLPAELTWPQMGFKHALRAPFLSLAFIQYNHITLRVLTVTYNHTRLF